MSTIAADAEAVVVQALNAAMDVPVSTRYRGGTAIRVTLAGGPRSNIVTDRPMVTVMSYAADSITASENARLAHAHLWALGGTSVGEVWVRRVTDVGGITFYPDPDAPADISRYQFTIELNLRPTPLEA